MKLWDIEVQRRKAIEMGIVVDVKSKYVSNLNAFARGINYYATSNLFLPEEYIKNTQSDVYMEWTTD
jgi:hypothetical protein